MSQRQRASIEAMLREVPLDAGGDPDGSTWPCPARAWRQRREIPPLLIRVGSHEVLLDDAMRLAAAAAAADLAVRLEVTPGVPHVFQAFAGLLDEGEVALARAGAFVRAHLGRA